MGRLPEAPPRRVGAVERTLAKRYIVATLVTAWVDDIHIVADDTLVAEMRGVLHRFASFPRFEAFRRCVPLPRRRRPQAT